MKKITGDRSVSDIVNTDYRTADVFLKYGIEYCCGGKWPLETICKMQGMETDVLCKELERSMLTIRIPNTLDFAEWPIDFLADYIVNIHHRYLRHAVPAVQLYVKKFADGHRSKYSYLDEVELQTDQLAKELIPHLQQEEEIIFPYIKQIMHAYESKETYASLLVRTLRKPVEAIMKHEDHFISGSMARLRALTNDYTPPGNACTSHKVTFFKLQELDNDMVQHIYLENNILFPKAILIEKELLENKELL